MFIDGLAMIMVASDRSLRAICISSDCDSDCELFGRYEEDYFEPDSWAVVASDVVQQQGAGVRGLVRRGSRVTPLFPLATKPGYGG